MKAGIVGNGPHAEARAAAIRNTDGVVLAEHLPEATAAGVLQRREAALDVVFASGGAGRRVQVAEAALRQGRHVFLEWPPAASTQELERLAEHAEEAGAEVGVSRPLRFHPLFDQLPAGTRVEMILVQGVLPRPGVYAKYAKGRAAPPDAQARLTDALDLCCALAGSGRVKRLDAEAARGEDARFEAVAGGLRFHTGAYAQVSLRRELREEAAGSRVYVAGPGFQLEADLEKMEGLLRRSGKQTPGRSSEQTSPPALLHRETQAFLDALREGRPVPVSILDGLAAMRLTERLMRQLR